MTVTSATMPVALHGLEAAAIKVLPAAPPSENLPSGKFSEAIHPPMQEPYPKVEPVEATGLLPPDESIEPKPAPKAPARSGSRKGREQKESAANAVPGGHYCTEKFVACTALGREWAAIETNASIRNANLLQSIAQFVGNKEFKIRDFKALCKSRNLACTNATIRAGYLPVIKAVYEDIGKPISDPQASKLNAALKWVVDQCKDADKIAKYFQEHGGVQGCLEERAASKGRTPKSKTCSPFKVANFPPECQGEVIVVLKITNGKGEFVRLIDPADRSQPSVAAIEPSVNHEEFLAESASDEKSDAGTADDVEQIQFSETESDKEQV